MKPLVLAMTSAVLLTSSAIPAAGATEATSQEHVVAPEAVVDAFAAALRAGDAGAIRRMMAPNAIVAESGGAERSLEEYANHHMPADMAFTAAVQLTLEKRDVIQNGDMATVVSQSRVDGQFRGRTIHSRSMETMVLRRIDGEWRIVHIHWSSSPITDDH